MMKKSVWGFIQADTQREGSPEAVIARCAQYGIEAYRGYPIPYECDGAPDVPYLSSIMGGRCVDYLERMAREGRRLGVRVEPWWIPGYSMLKDETQEQRQAWTYRSPAPGALPGTIACPSWPEVRLRGLRILQDMIAHAGPIDSIHMDVIRYADNPIAEPCHCDACRQLYRRHLGQDTLSREELEKTPGLAFKYLSLRGRTIRELVEQAREITRQAGINLTMAGRADYFHWALPEGQDWAAWAREGLIDELCLMNYFTDRTHHQNTVQLQMRLLGNRAQTLYYDGIGRKWRGGEVPSEQLIQHMQDAKKEGVPGICIYSYNALTDADFEAIAGI